MSKKNEKKQDLDQFASSLLLFLWNRRSACAGLLKKFTFR